MNRLFLVMGTLACCFLTACYAPDNGSLSEKNRTELNNFAARSVSIEKKYIKMMENMALLLKEVNEAGDPESAMDRLRKFYADDQYALRQINREVNGWYRYASSEDISNFLSAVNEDSASIKLRQLLPEVTQKVGYNLNWKAELDLLMSFLNLEH